MAWDDIPEWANDVTNSILQTVKKKDPFTFYHCCRVGIGSRKLAKAMGLNEFEQTVLEFSGLFHDIGKVGIPDDILLKPGKLTAEEVDIMKVHPIKSAEIIDPLSHIPFFRFLLPGIRYHHERIDGNGYPFNLIGERIPLPARVIAVVDSFDAMTNRRPYREPLSESKVIKELVDYSGSQFDANIVKVFLEALPHFRDEQAPEDLVTTQLLKAA
ncbi:MAG: HD-GYP domain-containing protein [Bdellovibrionales bacterium]|nr:HD-GYP domain-containing protein [Bdellovibrionales bacterium]